MHVLRFYWCCCWNQCLFSAVVMHISHSYRGWCAWFSHNLLPGSRSKKFPWYNRRVPKGNILQKKPSGCKQGNLFTSHYKGPDAK
ncbi:hypothetical protein EDD17DRAFT_213253 [Pisolithus thermaeus]|nr:hypothetical protein EDD17DRAFT_213253 [Pisolithus thermaeus]